MVFKFQIKSNSSSKTIKNYSLIYAASKYLASRATDLSVTDHQGSKGFSVIASITPLTLDNMFIDKSVLYNNEMSKIALRASSDGTGWDLNKLP